MTETISKAKEQSAHDDEAGEQAQQFSGRERNFSIPRFHYNYLAPFLTVADSRIPQPILSSLRGFHPESSSLMP